MGRLGPARPSRWRDVPSIVRPERPAMSVHPAATADTARQRTARRPAGMWTRRGLQAGALATPGPRTRPATGAGPRARTTWWRTRLRTMLGRATAPAGGRPRRAVHP